MINFQGFQRLETGRYITSSMGYSPTLEANLFFGNWLLKSDDYGLTWTIDSTSLPSEYAPSQLLETSDPMNRLLVRQSGSYRQLGLFVSDDQGDTFYRSWPFNPEAGAMVAPPQAVTDLTLNPFNQDIYLSGSWSGVMKSSDHGESWAPLPVPPGSRKVFTSYTEDAMYLRGDVDLHFQKYRFANGAFETLEFLPAHEDTLYYCSLPIELADGSLLAIGYKNHLPSGTTFFHTWRSDPQQDNWTAYGESVSGYIDHWQHPKMYAGENVLRLVQTAYDDTLGQWNYYVSTDTGQTWIQGEYPGEVQGSTFTFFQSDSIIHALFPYSGAYTSTDHGMTWQDMGFPDPYNNLLSNTRASYMNPATGEIYYFGYNTSFKYNGVDWERVDNSYNYLIYDVAAVPGEEPLFLAVQYDTEQVMITRDGWGTFRFMDLTWPDWCQSVFVEEINYDPYRERVWLSTSAGLFFMDVEDLAVDEGPVPALPHDKAILHLHPNPMNGSVKLNFELPLPASVQIDLFTLEGRLVDTLETGKKSAGSHTLTYQNHTLPSGVYFVRLHGDRLEPVIRKLVLLK